MGLVSESDFLEVVYTSLFVFWLVFVYFVRNYDYWLVRGVPHVPPIFPFGSSPQLVLGHVHALIPVHEAYQQFSKERFFGLFKVRSPHIVIKDPDLIKEVLRKKFDNFTDRSITVMNSTDYLDHNLLTMKGQEWKEMRIKLTPAYTACKMKMMFFLVKEVSDQLQKAVVQRIEASSIIDIEELVSRFAMDVIGTCAFGLTVNTLSNENSHFYKLSKSICRSNFLFCLKAYLVQCFPFINKIPLFSFNSCELRDFITNVIRENVNYRESNGVKRFDFLDLLIKIRQNESILDEDEISTTENSSWCCTNHEKKKGMMIEQIAAETYIFFSAGFETSSSVLTFCMYELSCNPNTQNKVFNEIEEVLGRHDGTVSFHALQEMTYLDQVINETMRLYPPFHCINRVCTKSYKIPKSEVTIEEGLHLIIPVYSLHHDPEYYNDPEQFDPERFSLENCKERHQYVYLPFGEGPRMCIGLRFGLMLVKVALVTLIKDYSYSLAPETPVPVQLDKSSYVLEPAQSIKLVLSPRAHQDVIE